jgi:hypothetical protein
LCSNEPEVGRARDIVARAAGLSPTTFQRAVKIIEKGSEKLKEKVRHGKMSIAYAYKMVLKREENCKPPKMPSGLFNDFQKAELAYPLLEIERQLAKQRQLSRLQFVRDNISLWSNDHNGEKGRAHEIVAKAAGLSPKTFQRAVKIIEKGSEKHSRKPEEVYGIIERMYPNGKYLELFARHERSIGKRNLLNPLPFFLELEYACGMLQYALICISYVYM